MAGGVLALGPGALDLDGTEAHLVVDHLGDPVDLGRGPHLFYQRGLVAPFERSVTAHAGHGLTPGVEAQEEERDSVPVLKFLPAQRSFESIASVTPFGLIEIALPQVGA